MTKRIIKFTKRPIRIGPSSKAFVIDKRLLKLDHNKSYKIQMLVEEIVYEVQ